MVNSNGGKSGSRSTYHHGDLRAELVRAGIRLLETTGAAEFSLREVARVIGVSAAAPYRHFPGKLALMEAIAAEGCRRLAVTVRQPEMAPGRAAREMAAFAIHHPAWWEAIVGGMAEAGGEQEAARSELFAELVGMVERTGDARDPEVAIRGAVALWAGVIGLARLRASGALTMLDSWMVPEAAELAEVLVSVRRSRSIPAPRR